MQPPGAGRTRHHEVPVHERPEEGGNAGEGAQAGAHAGEQPALSVRQREAEQMKREAEIARFRSRPMSGDE